MVFHAERILCGGFDEDKPIPPDPCSSGAELLNLQRGKVNGSLHVVNDNKIIACSGKFAERDLHVV